MADEHNTIAVESYQDIAFDGAWKARGRALWAVSAVGLAFGAATGLIAPFFPVLAGAQTLAAAMSLVPASMAVFSAVGMSAGFTAGITVGPSSGAAASVMREHERREKAKELAQTGKISGAATGAAKETPEWPKTFEEKVKDGVDTYFNPKVGALFTGLGIVAGLVMAAAFISLGGLTGGASAAVPALGLLLGASAGSATAVTAYFAGVMGCFGALFAFNFPKMTTDLTHVAGDYLSGERLGTQWGPAPEPSSPQPSLSNAVPEYAPPAVAVEPAPSRCASRPSSSFQTLLAQQAIDNSSRPLERR